MLKMQTEGSARGEEGKNTLFFIYFSGHGAMDNMTKAILNGPKQFPLEAQVRALSITEGCYVIAVFDCCREQLNSGTKGSGQPVYEEGKQNLIMTFGCKP